MSSGRSRRGGLDLDHVQAIEQILAELAGADLAFEALVRGRDDPEVDFQALVAADALELLLLEDPEQLGLHGRGDVADLVEEDRPLVGQLEPAFPPGVGRGEGASLVAEEFALQERLGQGRAVDGHEVPPELGRVVDRLGDQLLARAGLPLDQDGGLRPGDVADQLEDLVHPLVLADDVVEPEVLLELLAKAEDLVLELAFLQGPVHHQLQVGRIDRLGQEVVGAQAHGLDHPVDRAEGRRHDHGDQKAAGGDLADQVHPAHPGHPQVGDQDAVIGGRQGRQGVLPILDHLQADLVRLQQLAKLGAAVGIVIDDQELLTHATGSRQERAGSGDPQARRGRASGCPSLSKFNTTKKRTSQAGPASS